MPVPLSKRKAVQKPWWGDSLPVRVMDYAILNDVSMAVAGKKLKASLGDIRKATQIKKEYDEYTMGRIQMAISRSRSWS